MKNEYHIPVMPEESVKGLNLFNGAIIVDATFGGGGHSRLILDRIGSGRLFAFDRDEDAADNALKDDHFFFIRHNFRYLKNFLWFYDIQEVDGIIADLGVSWHDFDKPDRGFSFRFDSKLDMRMNRNDPVDAAWIINNHPPELLILIFKKYGGIKNSARLVDEIIKYRSGRSIETTTQLKKIAISCAPRGGENKYLAKVFQALRIEVNDEINSLQDFLKASLELLKTGGRLVVITYHSLEDRLCKSFMKTGNFQGNVEKDFYGNIKSPFRLVNKKVITPRPAEIERNPRSRSAKLRIAEKM